MRARYTGENSVHFPDLGPYLLSHGDVIDFGNHPDANPDAFMVRADFEDAGDAEPTVLKRGDAPAPEMEPEPVPSLEERIAGASNHAALHAIAVELGVEVPEDPKAAWGDAVRVDEKRAILEQAAAGAGEEEVSGEQGAEVIEEASD